MGHGEDRHRGNLYLPKKKKRKKKLKKTHIFNSMVYLKDLEKQEQTIPPSQYIGRDNQIKAESKRRKPI